MDDGKARIALEFYENGFYNLAASTLEELVAPSSQELFWLGEALDELDRTEDAAIRFGQAWRQRFFEAGDRLSSCLISLNRHDELGDHLNWAIDEGVVVPSLRLKGTIADDLGDVEEARRCYEAAIDAGDPLAHSSLGFMLAESGDLPSASYHFRIGAELGDWRAKEGIASLLETGAARSMEIYLGLVRDGYARGAFGLARVWRAQGNRVGAKAALRDAVDSAIEGAAEVLIEMLVEDGDFISALAVLDSSRDSNGDEWAERMMGRIDEARDDSK